MSETSEQLVTFYLHAELFGLEMKYVREIIRLPEMVRVPGAPAYFCGLANLRGEILPVLEGRKVLGMPGVEGVDSARVLVLEYRGETAGCLVDRLSEVITLEDYLEDELKTAQGRDKLLSRVVKKKDGSNMIMVINIETFFPSMEMEAGVPTASLQAQVAAEKESRISAGETRQFVGFVLGEEEFALPAVAVQEIVRLPSRISSAPGLPFYIEGLFSLRRQTVPLLNMRRYFRLGSDELGERARVVVLSLSKSGKKSVLGLGVDAITEVLRLSEEEIESLPELFKGETSKKIKGVCKLGQGERIVYLLDPQSMGEEDELSLGDEGAGSEEEERAFAKKALSAEELFVVFFLQEEEFAISINSVREIIRLPDIVRVPRAPHYVEGVVNIRGEILPVINVRKKLGLPEEERSGRNRIVVVDLNGVPTGLIVDAVREVRKIDTEQIAPVPSFLQSCLEADFLQGVVKFADSDRMIMLFRLQNLLDSAERRELARVTAAHQEAREEKKEEEQPELKVNEAGFSGVKADETEDEGIGR